MTQNDLLFTEIHFLLLRPLAEISLRIPWANYFQGIPLEFLLKILGDVMTSLYFVARRCLPI